MTIKVFTGSEVLLFKLFSDFQNVYTNHSGEKRNQYF